MNRPFVILAALFFSGLVTITARAEDSVAVLEKEYDAALKRYFAERTAAYEAAKKQGEEAVKALRPPAVGPNALYSPRFLAIAERNPKVPRRLMPFE